MIDNTSLRLKILRKVCDQAFKVRICPLCLVNAPHSLTKFHFTSTLLLLDHINDTHSTQTHYLKDRIKNILPANRQSLSLRYVVFEESTFQKDFFVKDDDDDDATVTLDLKKFWMDLYAGLTSNFDKVDSNFKLKKLAMFVHEILYTQLGVENGYQAILSKNININPPTILTISSPKKLLSKIESSSRDEFVNSEQNISDDNDTSNYNDEFPSDGDFDPKQDNKNRRVSNIEKYNLGQKKITPKIPSNSIKYPIVKIAVNPSSLNKPLSKPIIEEKTELSRIENLEKELSMVKQLLISALLPPTTDQPSKQIAQSPLNVSKEKFDDSLSVDSETYNNSVSTVTSIKEKLHSLLSSSPGKKSKRGRTSVMRINELEMQVSLVKSSVNLLIAMSCGLWEKVDGILNEKFPDFHEDDFDDKQSVEYGNGDVDEYDKEEEEVGKGMKRKAEDVFESPNKIPRIEKNFSKLDSSIVARISPPFENENSPYPLTPLYDLENQLGVTDFMSKYIATAQYRTMEKKKKLMLKSVIRKWLLNKLSGEEYQRCLSDGSFKIPLFLSDDLVEYLQVGFLEGIEGF